MITHKIWHIFRIRTRWNRQNCPFLSILNIRLTFPKINGQGFTPYTVLHNNNREQKPREARFCDSYYVNYAFREIQKKLEKVQASPLLLRSYEKWKFIRSCISVHHYNIWLLSKVLGN